MALSLGHLASLYNYDMEEYEKAEQLYLRSIAIGEHKLPLKSDIDCWNPLSLVLLFIYDLHVRGDDTVKVGSAYFKMARQR